MTVTAVDVQPTEPDEQPAPDMPAGAEPAVDAGEDAAQPDEQPAPDAGEEPTTEVAIKGHLAIDPNQDKWTPMQVAALRAIGIVVGSKKAEENFADASVRQFLHFCQARRLDPFTRDVYLLRYKSRGGEYTYSIQTSIDTYRRKAQETGRFRRKIGVFWTGRANDPQWWHMDPQTRVRYRVWVDVWLEKEPPAAAKCVIEHYDEHGAIVTSDAVANWEMFVATTMHNGQLVPNKMWTKGGPHMLGKCAEALVLRSAFPGTLSGLYVAEEMDHVRAEADAEYMRDLTRQRQEAFVKAQTKAADPGDTIEGELVETPAGGADAGAEERELLLAELDQQARVMGKSRTTLTNRLVLAHRCNAEDLPVEAVRDLVVTLRPGVADTWRQRGGGAAVDVYVDLPPTGHPDGAGLLQWAPDESGAPWLEAS